MGIFIVCYASGGPSDLGALVIGYTQCRVTLQVDLRSCKGADYNSLMWMKCRSPKGLNGDKLQTYGHRKWENYFTGVL